MSEKFDGVRAYWDGKGALWSKNGNRFKAPDWFVEDLPRGVPLDGELFFGRGKFDTMNAIHRTRGKPHKWEGVEYKVFDTPFPKPVEERFDYLEKLFAKEFRCAQLVAHKKCTSKLVSRLHEYNMLI